MPPEFPENVPDTFTTAKRFLNLTRLWSDAHLHGQKWMKSKLADLKIDLWLATEHEAQSTPQTEEMQRQIDILESTLRPSPFDPETDNGYLALQSAASDLAEYALQIARVHSFGEKDNFPDILKRAREFLESNDARTEAHKCMDRVLSRTGVLFEDVGEVLRRAEHLLSQV